MQHRMKCSHIREVCTHHECVHCFSFEVTHATYHMYECRMYVYICTYIFEPCFSYGAGLDLGLWLSLDLMNSSSASLIIYIHHMRRNNRRIWIDNTHTYIWCIYVYNNICKYIIYIHTFICTLHKHMYLISENSCISTFTYIRTYVSTYSCT